MSEPQKRETDSELESWRSSKTLCDATRQRVHKLLGEAVEDMDRLDRIISEKEADLARLYQEREVDKARIAALRGVISKARTLPPEILSEVFTHVCAESQVLLPPKKQDCRWTLGQVCSHWRRVLWSSPAVWTDIHVLDSREEQHGTTTWHNVTILKVLKYILTNTSTLLSLTAWENEVAVIYDTVVSNTRRFRALCLYSLNWKTSLAIIALPPQLFNNLEILRISVSYDHTLPAIPAVDRLALQNAPNLHTVAYSHYASKWGLPVESNCVYVPQFLNLPWEQLRNLSILFMPVPPSELHNIFSRCSALVTCKVICNGDPITPLKHTITLPHLEKIEISTSYYHETVDWADFLGPLVTPSLKDITIRSLAMSCQAFTSLFARSKCALEMLSLQPHDIKFQDPYVDSMLPHLASLTDMALGFPVDASFIEKIKDGVFPSLTYGEWVVQPDGWEAVLDLVDSRIQQKSSSLEWKFAVDLVCLPGRGFPEVHDRYLRRYKEYQGIEGLNLSFWDPEESEEIGPRDEDDKYW